MKARNVYKIWLSLCLECGYEMKGCQRQFQEDLTSNSSKRGDFTDISENLKQDSHTIFKISDIIPDRSLCLSALGIKSVNT